MLTKAEKEQYFFTDTKNFIEEITNRTEQINERTKTIYNRFYNNLNKNGTKVLLNQDQLHDIYDDCAAISELSSIMYTYEHNYLHDYQKFMQDVGTSLESAQANKVDHDINTIHAKAKKIPNVQNTKNHSIHSHISKSAAHSHQLGKEYFKHYTVQNTGSFSSRLSKMFKNIRFHCKDFAKAFFD